MKILFPFVFILICLNVQAQWSIGPETQVYPTGIIPGLRVEKQINDRSALNFRLGYQWIRHRDLGVHEDERGNGYGFSLGYRTRFSENKKGFSLIVRTDIWWNDIDWKDNIDAPEEVSGNTDIVVLQPTLVLEDVFTLSPSLLLIPSIGVGYEWNARTKGEPTGQGAILLIGVSLMKEL